MSSAANSSWDGRHGKLKYELLFDEASPSNNVIKGLHFHAYRTLRKRWQLMALAALGGVKPEDPVKRAYLEITRECAGEGLDWDNAYGGLKPLLDCLVCGSTRNPDGLGLIQDDNPKNMPFPPYVRQESAKRGQGRTIVRIYDLEADDSV